MIFQSQPALAVFEFSSLPMLGWLAAATLPWIIHRLYRRQHRITSWAAVELLLSAMRHRARRVQIQQWLLLAVRTAILVLVALAVAEPALRQLAIGAGGKALIHRIIVVDQSYSMGCRQQESSRWQLAQTQARRLVESSDGGALTLVGWSERAENLLGRPTFDTSVALAAIDDLQLSQTSANLPSVAQAVLAAIQRAELEMPQLAAHQVVFCTDLGRQTWQVDEAGRKLLEDIATQAQVNVVNVASGPSDNLAISALRIEPAITILQHEAAITATVTCYGQPTKNSVTIDFLVAGRRVDQQQIELSPNGEVTARFTHRFVDPGPQTVQVVLVGNGDCLPDDDSRWLVTDVRPRLNVACFAGQAGAADDLARALAPGAEFGKADSVIAPRLFSASELSEVNLTDYAAVLLSNVAELSSREATALTEYTRQGGGLAIFLGQIEGEHALGDLQQLLPVELHGMSAPGNYRFNPLEYGHPIVTPFRGQTQAGLLGVAVAQYQRFQLQAKPPVAEVVLSFDTGDPALVVGRLGLGRVAVSALPGSLAARTADGVPWSSFALSPSFLPVVRELVAYLIGDRWLQQRNIAVGEPAIFAETSSTMPIDVRLPSGVQRTLPLLSAEDRGQHVFRETNERGIYRFSEGQHECARFAVNLDGRDSDLSPLEATALPTRFMSTTTEGGTKFTNASTDFSFVRTLLGAALVLLLFEIGLAWQLGRGWG